jgi:ssDNA-binding Zn-finger/Zn-ribbon topoisomerase 1
VSLSNYPPGVTGNEYAIGGPQYEREINEECEECGHVGLTLEGHYEFGERTICPECNNIEYLEPEGPDPDEAYDRARDDALTEGYAHGR